MVHYRRYLAKPDNIHALLTQNDVDNLLKDYDFIVPDKMQFQLNMRDTYSHDHHAHDWTLTGQVIAEIYPDYLAAFHEFESQHKAMLPCNMFIGKKTLVDEYCQWLFDILFVLEQRVDLTHYDEYQKRIFGFLGERLFNIWLLQNQQKVRYCCAPILGRKATIVVQLQTSSSTVQFTRKNKQSEPVLPMEAEQRGKIAAKVTSSVLIKRRKA